jgi:hypothetical protein
MSEIVERVMKGIADAAEAEATGKWEIDWPFIYDPDSNAGVSLEVLARAAIAAMREPTHPMVYAAQDWAGTGVRDEAEKWRAMVDAALVDDTKPTA